MQIYRTPKFLRGLVYLFAAGLMFVAVMVALKLDPGTDVAMILVYILITAGCGGLAILLAREAWISRVIIEESTVQSISALGRRQLQFHQIRGFELNDKYLTLIPAEPHLKKVLISRHLSGVSDLIQWAELNFPDLVQEQIARQREEIMQNAEYGFTEEARDRRLRAAHKITQYLMYISTGTALWLLFFPRPYHLAISIGLLLPFVAITLGFIYGKLLKADAEASSAYPSAAMAVLLPSVSIGLRGFLDHNILDHSAGWIPMAIITLGVYLLYMLPIGALSPRTGKEYFLVVFYLPIAFSYGYGFVTYLNNALDGAAPTSYTVTVVEKKISSGKHTTYSVELTPWNEHTDTEIYITYDEYQLLEQGETVQLLEHGGYFSMPWAELDLASPQP